jgi:hypothetical protein
MRSAHEGRIRVPELLLVVLRLSGDSVDDEQAHVLCRGCGIIVGTLAQFRRAIQRVPAPSWRPPSAPGSRKWNRHPLLN